MKELVMELDELVELVVLLEQVEAGGRLFGKSRRLWLKYR